MNAGSKQILIGLVLAGLIAVTLLFGLPFIGNRPFRWPQDGERILAGTAVLAAATVLHGLFSFSVRDTILYSVLAFVIPLLAEISGVHCDFPFGARYSYHEQLQPVLPGGVPLFIPLAWLTLIRGPIILLRSFPVRDTQGRLLARQCCVKALLCALFVTGADLLLEPVCVTTGLWKWTSGGPYFGAPLTNLAGWFLVSLAVCIPYFAADGFHAKKGSRLSMAMDSLCAAAFILFAPLACITVSCRTGSVLPAALGLLVTLPFLLYWIIQSDHFPAS